MRAVIQWLWIPVLVALAWAGWIVFSRRTGNAEIDRAVEQKKVRKDVELLEKLGGSDLKVLMFYANPPVVERGKPGLLCYGVSNASTVAIEPGVTGTWPSISRCVEIRPAKDTSYTIKASDAQGKEVSQTVDVKVR